MRDRDETSSPFIWPPTIYGLAVLVGAALAWLSPWRFQSPGIAPIAAGIGIAVIGLGIAIAVAAEQGFKRAGTAVRPDRPTRALVLDGIYRFTRNPMYLGMTLVLAGIGMALDQLWFIIATPLAMFAVTKLAITREEAYLARRFGDAYLAYKRQVRRWL